MKHLLTILFLAASLTALSQTQSVKDSLFINRQPSPDTAFISIQMINKVLNELEENWNGKNSKAAAAAFDALLAHAWVQLKKKRAAQLKSKN